MMRNRIVVFGEVDDTLRVQMGTQDLRWLERWNDGQGLWVLVPPETDMEVIPENLTGRVRRVDDLFQAVRFAGSLRADRRRVEILLRGTARQNPPDGPFPREADFWGRVEVHLDESRGMFALPSWRNPDGLIELNSEAVTEIFHREENVRWMLVTGPPLSGKSTWLRFLEHLLRGEGAPVFRVDVRRYRWGRRGWAEEIARAFWVTHGLEPDEPAVLRFSRWLEEGSFPRGVILLDSVEGAFPRKNWASVLRALHESWPGWVIVAGRAKGVLTHSITSPASSIPVTMVRFRTRRRNRIVEFDRIFERIFGVGWDEGWDAFLEGNRMVQTIRTIRRVMSSGLENDPRPVDTEYANGVLHAFTCALTALQGIQPHFPMRFSTLRFDDDHSIREVSFSTLRAFVWDEDFGKLFWWFANRSSRKTRELLEKEHGKALLQGLESRGFWTVVDGSGTGRNEPTVYFERTAGGWEVFLLGWGCWELWGEAENFIEDLDQREKEALLHGYVWARIQSDSGIHDWLDFLWDNHPYVLKVVHKCAPERVYAFFDRKLKEMGDEPFLQSVYRALMETEGHDINYADVLSPIFDAWLVRKRRRLLEKWIRDGDKSLLEILKRILWHMKGDSDLYMYYDDYLDRYGDILDEIEGRIRSLDDDEEGKKFPIPLLYERFHIPLLYERMVHEMLVKNRGLLLKWLKSPEDRVRREAWDILVLFAKRNLPMVPEFLDQNLAELENEIFSRDPITMDGLISVSSFWARDFSPVLARYVAMWLKREEHVQSAALELLERFIRQAQRETSWSWYYDAFDQKELVAYLFQARDALREKALSVFARLTRAGGMSWDSWGQYPELVEELLRHPRQKVREMAVEIVGNLSLYSPRRGYDFFKNRKALLDQILQDESPEIRNLAAKKIAGSMIFLDSAGLYDMWKFLWQNRTKFLKDLIRELDPVSRVGFTAFVGNLSHRVAEFFFEDEQRRSSLERSHAQEFVAALQEAWENERALFETLLDLPGTRECALELLHTLWRVTERNGENRDLLYSIWTFFQERFEMIRNLMRREKAVADFRRNFLNKSTGYETRWMNGFHQTVHLFREFARTFPEEFWKFFEERTGVLWSWAQEEEDGVRWFASAILAELVDIAPESVLATAPSVSVLARRLRMSENHMERLWYLRLIHAVFRHDPSLAWTLRDEDLPPGIARWMLKSFQILTEVRSSAPRSIMPFPEIRPASVTIVWEEDPPDRATMKKAVSVECLSDEGERMEVRVGWQKGAGENIIRIRGLEDPRAESLFQKVWEEYWGDLQETVFVEVDAGGKPLREGVLFAALLGLALASLDARNEECPG